MCYVYATVDYSMVGWVGDSPDAFTGRMFVDLDLAGCPYSLKTNSGRRFDIQCPNTRVPISAPCNGQTSLSQSSTEAEATSLASGLDVWRSGGNNIGNAIGSVSRWRNGAVVH